ncbi:MAG: MmcQ/YjbR family DNA-binding protein [bacterium]|nr:MmcQ/YjbR family DNA-binding protein [bacterium]
MDKEAVLAWAGERYETEADYPWKDENAVLRHRKSKKWYGVILTVRRDRLGLPGEGNVDVLNVKCDPELIGSLRTRKGFFPAYHMNKEKWISILLDGSVEAEEIENLIDLSYELTAGA